MSIEEQLRDLLEKVTDRSSLVSLRVEIERDCFGSTRLIYEGYSRTHGWIKAEAAEGIVAKLNGPVNLDAKRREVAEVKAKWLELENQLEELSKTQTA